MRLIISATFLAIAGATISSGAASASEPMVIPERLQVLAKNYPIADRLKFNWSEPSTDHVGQYFSILAAINTIAMKIANENDRKIPIDSDFISAISAHCFFPPYKPPFVEKYWSLEFKALYDEKSQYLLTTGVGKELIDLPKSFSLSNKQNEIMNSWIKFSQDEYFAKIFDPRKLPGAN